MPQRTTRSDMEGRIDTLLDKQLDLIEHAQTRVRNASNSHDAKDYSNALANVIDKFGSLYSVRYLS